MLACVRQVVLVKVVHISFLTTVGMSWCDLFQIVFADMVDGIKQYNKGEESCYLEVSYVFLVCEIIANLFLEIYVLLIVCMADCW